MKNFSKILLLLLVLGACTPQSSLVYLQDKEESGSSLTAFVGEYLVKPTDILHVRVITSDPAAHVLFNMDDSRSTRTTSGGSGDLSMYIYGYTVDHTGVIHLPEIGDVPVAGLSLEDIQQVIQEKVNENLIGATVSVKLANFSVTILGEVKRPGNYYIYDNEFTIMDALGLAGDLTDYGNRNVNIVRRTFDGSSFATIDITSREAVSSEYFFMQPGDLIYVEPLPAKRAGFAQFPFGVVFSAISTTLLLINFLNTSSN